MITSAITNLSTENMLPLVSIIIPVYNADRYLARCLDSVLSQNYENLEIILINDGSTDGSAEICQAYSVRFPKLKVIHQANAGASLARKKGVQDADGEYLMFVDSDDFVSPNYVSALYEAIIKADASIALCPMKRIDVGDDPDFANSFNTRVMAKDELFSRFFSYEFWGFPGGIYRKDLFRKLHFPVATINEDYYVKAQMFAKVDFVGYIEESLYCYEQHPGSLSKQPLSLRALGEFDNALATWEYYKYNEKEYYSHALAIVSETACKWLGKLNNSNTTSPEINFYKNRIEQFISSNLIKIILNPDLLWKLKIVMLYNYLKSLF